MVRKQVRLTETQANVLKYLAQQRRVSVAELIRQSVDMFIASVDQDPLAKKYAQSVMAAGKYRSGDIDLGRRHDEYLVDAFSRSTG